MSKARITYRFEHNKRVAGGERIEVEPREQGTPLVDEMDIAAGSAGSEAGAMDGSKPKPKPWPRPKEASAYAEPSSKLAGDGKEDTRPGGNVVPLRHFEFEVSEAPVVIEEKASKEPPKAGEGAKPVSGSTGSGTLGRSDADYPYDFGAWKDSASSEADELERIIRDSGAYREEDEHAAREAERGMRRGKGERRAERAYHPAIERPRRERHPFDEPTDRDEETGYWAGAREEEMPLRTGSRRNGPQDGPALWKVAASVLGAIATGVLFGTFVLNLFTGEEAPNDIGKLLQANQPGSTAEGSLSAPAGAVVADPQSTLDPTAEVASALTTAAIDLPERRMFLLQNGMFESLESARALAEEMKSKGLAATIEEGEKFFVYAGVTSDRDSALRAGLKLQAADVEVYVKPYELPSVQQVFWSGGQGEAEALGDYLATGSSLVQMIGDLTLVHLDGDEAVAPEGATIAKLKAEHLALTELSAKASVGLSAESQPMLGRMDDAALGAIVAIEEYAAHPSHAYLWTAQSSLMDYIIAEKRLLTSIATR
ncbi:SPOR domain-containing protein [Paenibacillus sp. TRM 82003]|nr:SPOR domain-containing protein [Paenibacillus sp. TRM 82003]